MNRPPKHSFLDSDGNRWVTLDIDIMKNNGLTHHKTMRITLPVLFSFSTGYTVDCTSVEDGFSRYPTLNCQRNKVRICLDDAKPVPTLNPATATGRHNPPLILS